MVAYCQKNSWFRRHDSSKVATRYRGSFIQNEAYPDRSDGCLRASEPIPCAPGTRPKQKEKGSRREHAREILADCEDDPAQALEQKPS